MQHKKRGRPSKNKGATKQPVSEKTDPKENRAKLARGKPRYVTRQYLKKYFSSTNKLSTVLEATNENLVPCEAESDEMEANDVDFPPCVSGS